MQLEDRLHLRKLQINLHFRSVCTIFNLLRSLKLGGRRQVALLWETEVPVVATGALIPRRRKNQMKNLFFLSVCTNFNLLRSLKVGCTSENYK